MPSMSMGATSRSCTPSEQRKIPSLRGLGKGVGLDMALKGEVEGGRRSMAWGRSQDCRLGFRA